MKTDPGQDEIKTVRQTIFHYRMIEPGDRVVVAVSGGPDSVCLLDILFRLRHELKVELVVAHLDHGLRPDVDASETRFVGDLAESLSLPFVTRKTEAHLTLETASLEEKARDLRYAFLRSVKAEQAAQKIATGHTLDDQAETVLMRLIRGSGSSGLAGIPPVRNQTMIRPLIDLTRDAVREYLSAQGLSFLTDASNKDPTYLRNHIRLNLIPGLKAIQPNVVEHLGRTAELMRAEKTYLAQEAARWLARWTPAGKGRDVRFPLDQFKALPEAISRHVVRQALLAAGGTLRRVSLVHIEAVEHMADGEKPQTSLTLPNGVWAIRRYGILHFTTGKPGDPADYSQRIDGPGQWRVKGLGVVIRLEEVQGLAVSEPVRSPWTAYLDRDRVRFPMVLRNIRPGDRFVPLGMSGKRKVKDLFIDLKIPVEQRKQIPLLTQGDEILWVCGVRIDDRFKITPKTERVLRVSFQPSEPLTLFRESR
jgi:tRNA(Ile)-lysidine synthase